MDVISRFFCIALLAACAAGMLGGPARSQSAPDVQASAPSETAFSTLKQSVATTQQKMGEVEHTLSAIATSLETQPDSAAAPRADLMQRLAALRTSLQQNQTVFGRFAETAKKAVSADDMLDELKTLSQANDGLRGQLRALAGTLNQIGGNGTNAAVSADAHGRLATDLAATADQLDHLQKPLNLAANQAQLRSPGSQDDARFRHLVAQYGEDFAAAAIYVPASAPEVFRPSNKALDVALIWDDQAEEWHRVKGEVPVETIYRDMSLALGRAPTSGQLKYLAGNYGQVEKREKMASAFGDYLRAAAHEENKPQNQAFAHLSDGGNLLTTLGDTAVFRVKFVYDGQFRDWLYANLDHMRQDLIKQGPPAKPSLQELDALLDVHGITLDSQWAEGVLPAVGAVRVVAWVSDKPKDKLVSTWRFEKEKVAIDIASGHGNGTRKGNVVRSEGSLPGRNCTAADVRTFKEGGTLTFSATYTCTQDDGTTNVTEVSGAGTWQLVSPRPTAQKRGK